jgi:uncharacterized radical SAM superfamily Fe-S cluster-containing enzyme
MTACCVLIDVTARCDQRCPWCFARAGAADDSSEPSLDEIGSWYDRLIELGEERPFNIQISGGEPAVRDDLPEIIALGRAKGFSYIQLNTNGRRLGASLYGNGETGEAYARRLAEAGLTTVFMQFDGMSDEVYEELRGEPLLNIKLRAIENCAKAGLPVTLVPTIVKGVNIFEQKKDGSFCVPADDALHPPGDASASVPYSPGEIGGMIEFMLANLGVIKGIHFQPASFFGRFPEPPAGTTNEGQPTLCSPVDTAREEQHFSRSPAGTMNEGQPTLCSPADTTIEEQPFLRSPAGASSEEQPYLLSTDGTSREEQYVLCSPDRVTMFAVMDEIERQTNGRMKKSDLLPITTGHPLCCFCANFLRETNGSLTSTATDEQRDGGLACCCDQTPDPLDIVRRDRDFVLNKWQSPSVRGPAAPNSAPSVQDEGQSPLRFHEPTDDATCCSENITQKEPSLLCSLDEALDWLRGNMFTISGMGFMDASNLDAERLKRCRVQYYTPDDRLIPFCAYNTFYR